MRGKEVVGLHAPVQKRKGRNKTEINESKCKSRAGAAKD